MMRSAKELLIRRGDTGVEVSPIEGRGKGLKCSRPAVEAVEVGCLMLVVRCITATLARAAAAAKLITVRV